MWTSVDDQQATTDRDRVMAEASQAAGTEDIASG
jgi:hypothetical protein